MARLATVILLSLLLITLGAGLAASAGAIPIITDVTPTPLKVFTDIGDGEALGLAAGPNGLGYVCGYKLRLLHEEDMFYTTVANASVFSYDGPAHGTDKAWDIAYSSKGGVYVAGSSERANGDSAAVLIRCRPNLARVWVRRWNGPAGSNPSTKKVLIDGRGRALVVGSLSVDGKKHIYLAKYSTGGKLLWTRVYKSGQLALVDDALLDADGNTYVAGRWMAAGEDQDYDGLLFKVSPAGKVLWASKWDALGLFEDFHAICRRPAGGVYVAGTSEASGSDFDGVLLRYTASGGGKVIARVGTADEAYTEFYDIARTTDGSLAVCGGHAVGAGPSSFLVASYKADGTENWYRAWPSTTGSSRAELLVARADGAMAASGFWARQSGTGPQDVMTYFINKAGIRRARNQWAGPTAGEPWPLDMAAKGSSVWVAGVCYGNGSGKDAYAMRLVP